jgi:hypothetical protein
VKRAFPGGDGGKSPDERRRDVRGQRSCAGHHVIAKCGEHAFLAAAFVEPCGAPEVGTRAPLLERSACAIERCQLSLLRANLFETVIRHLGEASTDANGRAQGDLQLLSRKQRQIDRLLRAPGPRLPRQIVDRRADQAVPGAQPVIQECEGLVGRKRSQPERQPRQLHRHRVQVHAK